MITQVQAHVESVANAQAVQNQAADLAAQAAKAEASEAVILAKKVIKGDMKRAAETSKGIFEVIRTASDWAEAKSAFEIAENRICQEYKVGSMAELQRETGVTQFSYVSIKNSMLKAANESEKLGKDLDALYAFEYEGMSKEDQAKNAQEHVPEGFLNPWHSRYKDSDDEKGVTRFNRDRRLATNALSTLEKGRKARAKERQAAEQKAAERHQDAMRQAAGTADTAVAGSGQTEQGIAGATAGRSVTGGRTLSVVLQREYGLFTNALYAASEELSDAAIIPILTRAHDELVAMKAAAQEATRKLASTQGNKPVVMLEGIEEVQADLEPGEVQIAQQSDDAALDELDAAILEEFEQNEAGQNVDPSEKTA